MRSSCPFSIGYASSLVSSIWYNSSTKTTATPATSFKQRLHAELHGGRIEPLTTMPSFTDVSTSATPMSPSSRSCTTPSGSAGTTASTERTVPGCRSSSIALTRRGRNSFAIGSDGNRAKQRGRPGKIGAKVGQAGLGEINQVSWSKKAEDSSIEGSWPVFEVGSCSAPPIESR